VVGAGRHRGQRARRRARPDRAEPGAPTIATSLHASTSDLQWISDAYSLVLAAAMLPAGLLGDRLGRKKVLLAALVLFGASSAACAYASGTGELIAARAVLASARRRSSRSRCR